MAVAKRDGLNCYICGKPWQDGLSKQDILDLARKLGIINGKPLEPSEYQTLLELDSLGISKLVLEHKNNLSGDELDNLGLAHQSCNLRKEKIGAWSKSPKFLSSKRLKKYTMGVCEIGKRDENDKIRIEFKTLLRNIEIEPRFVKAGNRLLKQHEAIPVQEFIPAACQDAATGTETISVPTGQRYYSKYASQYAVKAIWQEFEMEIGGVTIKMVRLKEKK